MSSQYHDPVLLEETGTVDVVTEIRREAALLKTGALQNAILNSANFSSIATDEKGVIQLFNVGAECMLGYTAAEVVDKITPADISDPQEVIARAKAMWTLKEGVGRDALVSVLSDETKTSSGFITRQKREALRMLHTPKTMFMFVLQHGANFAPVLGLGAGVSSLQGILSDPSVSGRAAAALLLSADKDPEVIQALQDALADKDWSVRAAAVHAIALRNDPALEPVLIPLLEDKKEAVRVRAAAGYLRLEGIKDAQFSAARNQELKKRTPAPLAATGKN